MGLQKEIKELNNWVVDNVPAETRELMTQATERLVQSGIVNNARQTGDKAPSFLLPNVNGEIISSANLLNDGPMVLSFYRGAW